MSLPRTTVPDVGLAARCVAGDRAAQRELFEREKHRVHATLYRLLGSNHDMEDLVQEAFVQVFGSLKKYEGRASLATWINRVTARVAYAHFGTRQRAPQLISVPDIPAGDASAERVVMARQASLRLYEILERVDKKRRLAFALYALAGWSLKEVARAMDATLVATKARVWRARREIAKRAQNDPLLAEFVGRKTHHREVGDDG